MVQLSRQISLLLKRIANIFLSEHVLFGCGCTAKESFRKRAELKMASHVSVRTQQYICILICGSI